jgi:putative addiction module component (TIGR02574 family)
MDAKFNKAVKYSEEFKRELERRWLEYKNDPSMAVSLVESKKRIQSLVKAATEKSRHRFS